MIGLDFFLNHAKVKAKNWREPGLVTCVFIRLGDWHWISPDMRVIVCLANGHTPRALDWFIQMFILFISSSLLTVESSSPKMKKIYIKIKIEVKTYITV